MTHVLLKGDPQFRSLCLPHHSACCIPDYSQGRRHPFTGRIKYSGSSPTPPCPGSHLLQRKLPAHLYSPLPPHSSSFASGISTVALFKDSAQKSRQTSRPHPQQRCPGRCISPSCLWDSHTQSCSCLAPTLRASQRQRQRLINPRVPYTCPRPGPVVGAQDSGLNVLLTTLYTYAEGMLPRVSSHGPAPPCTLTTEHGWPVLFVRRVPL